MVRGDRRRSSAFESNQHLRESEPMPPEPSKTGDSNPLTTSETLALPRTPSFRLDGRRALAGIVARRAG